MSCLDLVDAGLMLREVDARTPEERDLYTRAFWRGDRQPSPAPQSPRVRGPDGAPR